MGMNLSDQWGNLTVLPFFFAHFAEHFLTSFVDPVEMREVYRALALLVCIDIKLILNVP